ncbi:class I SAM-dependent methyltransferase [Mycobacterium sp.]|uniref:class I SAM-dependent methyltransferase n=1 Tax=Mycobacterium sp. TaxID=1785 RepID=UPI002D4551A6|nr:class I SAM-dependent methyltransferase [Mycobacterium sp.]HZA12152.1 class I SAM-dependent methyltransferase [Mycobacterium sp.]
MPRTDHDSWEITESVGATALGVAAARAAETDSERPLFRDPFARVFLDAAGPGIWNMFDSSALPAELADVDPDLPARMRALGDLFACRTAFIDDFFRAASGAGLRQVVILAAGLDARAWRLAWPAGTRVYELDLPKVLEFKSDTLRAHGAKPTSERIEVPIDLREDWPAALRHGGFDAGIPTAWSAEGLLRYLPAQAQDLLFERIQALSCVGSRIAVNAPTSDVLDPERLERDLEQAKRLQTAAGRLGNTDAPDIHELWYAEERTDVGQWLDEHGWRASMTNSDELLAQHGRGATGNDIDTAPTNVFISAERVR